MVESNLLRRHSRPRRLRLTFNGKWGPGPATTWAKNPATQLARVPVRLRAETREDGGDWDPGILTIRRRGWVASGKSEGDGDAASSAPADSRRRPDAVALCEG